MYLHHMAEKQGPTLRTVMFLKRWDIFLLKIWKKKFQMTWVTDTLKLSRDAFTLTNATGGITFSVIIMSLETLLRRLFSGKTKCIWRSKGLLGNDPGKTLQPAVDFFKHFLKPSELWYYTNILLNALLNSIDLRCILNLQLSTLKCFTKLKLKSYNVKCYWNQSLYT